MKYPDNASFLQSTDGLSIYYRDYGDEHDRAPVICLPGLTRNSRDFDELAEHLADRRRVLTMDFRGRGFSEHDPNWANYHPGTYVADVWHLLDTLNVHRVVVIGTSLGGLCAMAMAAQHPERLAGVVLNDIGPEIHAPGLERIKQYTGRLPAIGSWDEAVEQARNTYGDWLPGLGDEDWLRMARKAYREDEHGVPRLDIDKNIGRAIREASDTTADAWAVFAALADIPTLLIWGEMSDILTQEIIDKMVAAKPDLAVVPVPNRGHVPLLDEPEALAAIDSFLDGME